MSISSAMYTAASGLESASEGIDVVSDNISNADTVGFKEGRAVFEDLMTQQSQDGSGGIGLGTVMTGSQTLTSQGSLESTGQANDMAINGSGYFIVNGTDNGVSGNFYTRAGQFSINSGGMLVNPSGLQVQGYAANAAGVLSTGLSSLQVSGQTVPPAASANATVVANLDSSASVPAAFDPLNPTTTSNFSTSMTVYDSLGTAQNVNIYFHNNGGGAWDWHALVDGSQVTGGTAGTPFQGASGTLTFNTDGSLQTVTGNASTWNFVNATAGQAINFNFGTGTSTGGTGMDGITQFANASSVTAQTQDGFAAGSLQGYTIDNAGTITGSFSNGQKQTIGQIALATFAAPDQMQRLGSTIYSATTASGEPLVASAQSGSGGGIVSGSLEQSNVDLGQQFVDMIAYERAYQSSSKVIQTSDQMTQTLVQLNI